MSRAGGGTPPRLHVVTDDATLATPGWASLASAVLEAGGEDLALHVRGPQTSGRVIHDLVRTVRDIAARHSSRVVVNDRVDVAMAAGVVDAHLGRRSLSIADAVRIMGPDARIGVSCHDRVAALAARKGGARYLFAGSAYETASHPGAAGRGVAWLASMVESGGPIPVLAIGGVDPDRVAELRAAGCAGVAVLRGIWSARDPAGAVVEYIQKLNEE